MTWLDAVRAALRAGERQKALGLVVARLREAPQDVVALVWFAALTPEQAKAVAALRYALQLDPNNAAARRGLAALTGKAASEGVRPAEQGAGAAPAASSAAAGRQAPEGVGAAGPPRRALRIAKRNGEEGPAEEPAVEARPPAEEQSATAAAESGAAPRQEPAQEVRGAAVLQRARAVSWPFRGLHRPLGSLLQVGLVEERDLHWAAAKARQAEVRWAAAVLLREDEIQDLRLTVSQAAATLFPFRRLQRPLGDLLREGRITLRDLAYALHKGYSPRLRQAAALMGYLVLEGRWPTPAGPETPSRASAPAPEVQKPEKAPLPAPAAAGDAPPSVPSGSKAASKGESQRQPAPTPSPEAKGSGLRVFRGSRYLDRQFQRYRREALWRAWLLEILLFGVGFLILGGGLYLYHRTGERWMRDLAGLAILPFFYGFWRLVPWLDRAVGQRNAYRDGLAGEERLEEVLRTRLDGRWSLYRNLNLPDGKGDLDAVLVGPRGVYLLEVKAYKGTHRYRGNEWYRKVRGKWRELDAHPSKQAFRNALRLASYLQAQGTEVWVNPRVVWAGQGRLWIDGRPEVPVWDLNRPAWMDRDLGQGKALEGETRERVEAALQALWRATQEAA